MNNVLFKQRLHQLIATPSVSCTTKSFDMSNKPMVDLLANWFENKGFKADIMPVEGEEGKYNLLATKGEGVGGLVLSGHTDTVPCNPEKWEQDPFKLKESGDRFSGLGTTDMKGFFAVVLAAIEQLDTENLNEPLIILATADEESSMSGARALQQSGMPSARWAIVGEPTELTPIRMHKGMMMESIKVQGLAGHSSNPALGHNALDTMGEVMNTLKSFRANLKERYTHAGFDIHYPTLNFGCIHGGDNPNRICGQSELHFDLRPLPGMSNRDLHNEITQLLTPLGEAHQTPIKVEALFGGISAFEEPAHSELVKVCEQLTNKPAKSVAFATEAPFLQALGMQTVVLGPGTIDCAHQPNEYLSFDQINPAIDIIKRLIVQRCIKK